MSLIVEPLIGDAASLSDDDLGRIEEIALGTEEIAGRFVSRNGRVAGLVVSVALPDTDRQSAKAEVTDFLRATAVEIPGRACGHRLPPHRRARPQPRHARCDRRGYGHPRTGGARHEMLLVAVILLRSLWGTLAIVIMLAAVLASSMGFIGWTGMKFFGGERRGAVRADGGHRCAFRAYVRGRGGGPAPGVWTGGRR